jgi:hypothetical protein
VQNHFSSPRSSRRDNYFPRSSPRASTFLSRSNCTRTLLNPSCVPETGNHWDPHCFNLSDLLWDVKSIRTRMHLCTWQSSTTSIKGFPNTMTSTSVNPSIGSSLGATPHTLPINPVNPLFICIFQIKCIEVTRKDFKRHFNTLCCLLVKKSKTYSTIDRVQFIVIHVWRLVFNVLL